MSKESRKKEKRGKREKNTIKSGHYALPAHALLSDQKFTDNDKVDAHNCTYHWGSWLKQSLESQVKCFE